ncbi:MAG: hypothetical protein DRQ61_02600 [Gammaproteobacteria bacterium]|nr:MAG: hypothetical protein DRQ56_00650 [Gammaproteobacteria bacterium]RLA23886.1 MAG: hypothetical protein DRQ61_02600 [Gammaproteobacteria bacterium]
MLNKMMAAVLFSLFFFSTTATAHGGLSADKDLCLLSIGAYKMHFTGYQPDSSATKEFCEDIPATGLTIVAMDVMDRKLKDMPTEVRVIEGDAEAEPTEANTILHMPFKLYPTGNITFEHNFPKEGKFVGIVSIKDGDEVIVSRFPFAVGMGGGFPLWLLLVVVVAVGGAVAYKRMA